MDELEEATKRWDRYFKSDEEIAEEEKKKMRQEAFDHEVARLDFAIRSYDRVYESNTRPAKEGKWLASVAARAARALQKLLGE